jgi:hypothetical protein
MHKGLPIKGYVPQSDINIDMVNKNKRIEESILRVMDAMKETPAFDQRWLAIARTHLEQGFMALNRSIFQPTRITLPEDE